MRSGCGFSLDFYLLERYSRGITLKTEFANDSVIPLPVGREKASGLKEYAMRSFLEALGIAILITAGIWFAVSAAITMLMWSWPAIFLILTIAYVVTPGRKWAALGLFVGGVMLWGITLPIMMAATSEGLFYTLAYVIPVPPSGTFTWVHTLSHPLVLATVEVSVIVLVVRDLLRYEYPDTQSHTVACGH